MLHRHKQFRLEATRIDWIDALVALHRHVQDALAGMQRIAWT
jgi:hypothetical protein